MPSVKFQLNIQAKDIEKYYQGRVLTIITTTTNGLKVQFPAKLVIPHITHHGVKGLFLLAYDQNGKAESLKAIP